MLKEAFWLGAETHKKQANKQKEEKKINNSLYINTIKIEITKLQKFFFEMFILDTKLFSL